MAQRALSRVKYLTHGHGIPAGGLCFRSRYLSRLFPFAMRHRDEAILACLVTLDGFAERGPRSRDPLARNNARERSSPYPFTSCFSDAVAGLPAFGPAVTRT
jgi:hypothetical protein